MCTDRERERYRQIASYIDAPSCPRPVRHSARTATSSAKMSYYVRSDPRPRSGKYHIISNNVTI